MTRPTPQEWALGVATAVATRGECSRRQVGAVIIDRNGRIAGAGYNGSYPGGPSCLKGECPRGVHYQTDPGSDYCACACGESWPCPEAVPAGSSYDTGSGACHAVHAELNALLDVSDRNRLDGATLYITTNPCDGCLKIIRNTPIKRIKWAREGGGISESAWPFRDAR